MDDEALYSLVFRGELETTDCCVGGYELQNAVVWTFRL